ncbi:hypothetical protein [Komagataeibacter oboediens]|uniref:Phage tail assembly protein n=1 Tax=Komagataeibacter oboediens TaxID=65958 RepID=A0ABS5SR22_9PROT|nr:hypothetical protein [Komagataeibacter oboediens]MBL7232050.1 hypothetical protein [Komagataeibacter oboediens]MBT0676594.1 hypothetical protein [Komagataeibacter oboediens]MBT0679969.1 hypothetical protein [Komagataeibacter oboediens]
MNAPVVNGAATPATTPAATAPVARPDRPKLPEGAEYQANGSVKVTLQYPVEQKSIVNGTPQTELVSTIMLNRLKGRGVTEMLNVEGEGDRIRAMLEASAGMTGPKADALLGEMDGEDFLTLSRVASTFLKSGAKTGRSS